MKRWFVPLVAALAISGLIILGCGQPAAPAPTQAPAKPAAAPTTAPAAAPKVAYPEKGKVITLNIPWGAGGSTDVTARTLSSDLEKALGVTIQPVNKTGGSSQVGLTEFVKEKPDGYAMAFTNLPSTHLTYLDPARKAPYALKDFAPIANYIKDPFSMVVSANGKYKTLKDVIDAAKAGPPGTIKVASSGNMSPGHLSTLLLEKAAGVKFATLFFDQQGEQRASLLGGHTDVEVNPQSEVVGAVKSGEVKPIVIFDSQSSKYLPDVPTSDSLGYKVAITSQRGVSFPAGTSPETVRIVAEAVKKLLEDPAHVKKVEDMYLMPFYQGSADFTKTWQDMEGPVKQLIEEATKK